MKGSVKPKGHGKWELVFDIGRDPLTNRRRQRSRSFTGTKRAAEQQLRSLLRDFEQGRLTGREMTVSDLMDKWLTFAQDSLSPTTYHEYQRLAVKRVVPAFGDVPLTQLKTRQLDDFYKALKDKAGLSASSVRQVHSIIRRCLKQGVKWGLLEHNAAMNATPPPIERKEVQPPPIDVIRILVAEATAYDPTFGVLVRLAIATGLRRSELCGLMWEDIDYTTSTMRVQRAIVETQGTTQKKSTKTRATRRITLGDTTIELLKQHQGRMTNLATDNAAEINGESYVFSQALDGSTPMQPYKVTDWFRNLPSNDRKIRFHDLRHAHATQLLGNGIDIPTVATRLGHATPTTTLNTYAHALKQNDQTAAQLIDEML